MTTCAVLRCQREATETFRPDETLGNFEVCREHLAQIHADALWVVDERDPGVLLLGEDSEQAWVKILREYQARGGPRTEIVPGEPELVVQLDLTYGLLGVKGSRDLQLILSLPMAWALGQSLVRLVDEAPDA